MNRFMILLKNINYLTKHVLWNQREEDIVYLSNKIIDDIIYEYNIRPEGYHFFDIMNVWDSIDYISSNNKSFVRFGDGEINLMKGMSQPFQEFDKELVERLYRTLAQNDDNLAVGINRDYYVPLFCEQGRDYNRRHAYDFRCFFSKYCNKDRTYLDGSFTFWNFGEHSKESELFWNKWKNMFRGKKIAIVSGTGVLDKLEHDVFELCSEKIYIYGPNKHAWREHDRIIAEIKDTVGKDYILVFILGMAGKAMIPETTQMGYISWDIGHLAKSYDAYMKNVEYTQENIANFYAPD